MANVIYIGESKSLLFTIKNANGTAANLTGATATWRLASNFTAAAIITRAGVVSNPVGGIVVVNLDEVDTVGLQPDKYIHELVILLDGNTIVASTGTIDVLRSVFVP